jgi:hypothetical protein
MSRRQPRRPFIAGRNRVHLQWFLLDEGDGRWCDRCRLPSVYWQTSALACADSLQIKRRALFQVCRDQCGDIPPTWLDPADTLGASDDTSS